MRTVVALGGNALVLDSEADVDAQRERIDVTADQLAALDDHELVLTHGNGPQVGALLRQQEASEMPARSLDVLVAETQAQVGYLVQQALDERFDDRVASVVTQVEVDPDAPAFDDPTKPIGHYLDEAHARACDFETTEVTTPAGRTAYRRVVPSPMPQTVLERDRIDSLVADGAPVICGGGGGVPVTVEDGAVEGVDAVVDKDHTSRLVADRIDADRLVMVTDVPYACTDFGTADETPIEDVDAATMRTYLDRGEFEEGSMQPKVEACLAFLDAGGGRAIITAVDDVEAAVAGDAGTQIRPGGNGSE